jgi:hypothetical protein
MKGALISVLCTFRIMTTSPARKTDSFHQAGGRPSKSASEQLHREQFCKRFCEVYADFT